MLRLSEPLIQWVEKGNVINENTLYVYVQVWDGNVHAYRATVHKGGVYIGHTGACKNPGRAAEAASRLWHKYKEKQT